MTTQPDPARADVACVICADVGTDESHYRVLRCSELAALRAENESLRQRIDHLWPDIPWIEPKVQRCKKGLHEMTQANSGQGRNYRGAYTYCIACRQARRSA